MGAAMYQNDVGNNGELKCADPARPIEVLLIRMLHGSCHLVRIYLSPSIFIIIWAVGEIIDVVAIFCSWQILMTEI